MINFDTDRLVIVAYPWGAGGKFLINCLGLSDNAVFQDFGYASQQLDGKYNRLDKINYIQKKLSEAKNNDWVDLDLGCCHLTAVLNEDYLSMSTDDLRKHPGFHPVISNLSQRNSEYFFMVAHSQDYLDAYLKVWPNAKIIILKNCEVIQNFREAASEYKSIEHPNCLFYWDCDWFFDPEKQLKISKNCMTC